MRCTSMFPKVEPLPCSQREPTILNWDGNGGLGENAANMGWHVIWALVGVLENGIAVRDESGEEAL